MNRRMLGTALIVLGVFTALDGWAALGWRLSYWDHNLVESYRGYDIHYFPEINVYGADTGGEPQTWSFADSVEALRGLIDNWLDAPEYVETYRGYTVFREPGGARRYYAIGEEGASTSYWKSLDGLKGYIDELVEGRALSGRWWINDIEITSPDQVVVVRTGRLAFRFQEAEDRAETVTVTYAGAAGGSLDLVKGLEAWTGEVEVPDGEYDVVLYARGGRAELTLSVSGVAARADRPQVRWAVGATISAAGLALLLKPEKPKRKK